MLNFVGSTVKHDVETIKFSSKYLSNRKRSCFTTYSSNRLRHRVYNYPNLFKTYPLHRKKKTTKEKKLLSSVLLKPPVMLK